MNKMMMGSEISHFSVLVRTRERERERERERKKERRKRERLEPSSVPPLGDGIAFLGSFRTL